MLCASAMGEKELGQVSAVGGGRRKDWREAASLRCIGVGAVLEQETNGFRIATESERSVERLVRERVGGDGGDAGAGSQERGHTGGSPKGASEMQGRPAVSGVFVYLLGMFQHKDGEASVVPDRGGFKDVEQNGVLAEGCAQKITDYRLTAIDGPHQRGDTLSITPDGKPGIGVDSIGNLGRCAGADEAQEVLIHWMPTLYGPGRMGADGEAAAASGEAAAVRLE